MKNTDVMSINTLGDLIKFHREKKNFSIDELSRKTKIRIHQLINLEENKLSELPNRVYLIGFLKALSEELEMNLDLALKFLNESNIKEEVLEFLPLGNEIKPLPFKFMTKSDDNKILIAAIIVCSLTIAGSILISKTKEYVTHYMNVRVHPPVAIIGKKQLMESDVISTKMSSTTEVIPGIQATPVQPLISKEQPVSTKPQAIEKSAEPTLQQLTITAKKGVAFIAFRVDQDRLVKFFLKPGKVIELKGKEIRLDAGNPDVLEITKNGEPLTIEKMIHNSKLHIVFPADKELI